MWRSSIRAEVAGRRTGWAWRCSCARCRGWGSCLMRSAAAPAAAVARLAERLGVDPGVLLALRAAATRPAPIICGWSRSTWAGGVPTALELQGAGGVPAGAGDGARLADAAVPAGVRVPDLGAGDPAGRGDAAGDGSRTARERAQRGDLSTGSRTCSPSSGAPSWTRLLVVDAGLGTTRLAWLTNRAGRGLAGGGQGRARRSWRTCAGWTRTRWTCRCCRPSGAGSWPRWAAGLTAQALARREPSAGTRSC